MRKVILILVLVAAALSTGLAVAATTSGDAKAKASERVIYLSAVEWKGSANVSKEAFPTSPLPEGGGYERFAPDEAGDWSVETYRFDSAMVAACQGEKVTLKIFGVNAAFHDVTIPNFKKAVRVSRGQLATVSFIAKKAGIFPIICLTHQPSHRADLLVLDC